MSEQNKPSKKRTVWIVILFSLSVLGNLSFLLSLKDWSHHRFEALGYIISCLLLCYAIFVVIKKYKDSV